MKGIDRGRRSGQTSVSPSSGSSSSVAIWSLGPTPQLLATHARSRRKGVWVLDPTYWDGLAAAPGVAPLPPCAAVGPDELEPVWARIPNAAVPMARRDLATYDAVGRVA